MKTSCLEFGDFRLYPLKRLLEKDGVSVTMNARTMDILLALVSRTGEVVSKEELLEKVWPSTTVDQGSIRVHMSFLRKALGQKKSDDRPLRNVSGKGYSFVASVTATSGDGPTVSQVPSKAALPGLVGRMFGRDVFEKIIMDDLLSVRFVTITGPGGVGKTKTAISVANQIDHRYRDGAYFADLASAGDASDVEQIVMSLFKAKGADDTAEDVLDQLRKMSVLLILDNCEHVLEAARAIAQKILTFAPDVHVLTTSRRPTGAACERIRRLPPLTLPATLQDALHSAAVELFVARANAVSRDFTVSEENAGMVAELVRKLDGIPFAIELAAARMEEFGLEAVSSLVEEDTLGFLTNGRRTAQRKHQSLVGLMEWSVSLLPPDERMLFERLSQLEGQFSVAEVRPLLSIGDDRVIEKLLEGLHAASLLEQCGDSVDGRYAMLGITGRFAKLKLHERGRSSSADFTSGSDTIPVSRHDNLQFAVDRRLAGSQ